MEVKNERNNFKVLYIFGIIHPGMFCLTFYHRRHQSFRNCTGDSCCFYYFSMDRVSPCVMEHGVRFQVRFLERIFECVDADLDKIRGLSGSWINAVKAKGEK